MSEIKSQSELEGMLNDPEKMSEYVKEKALDVLGSAVKEQMDEALEIVKHWMKECEAGGKDHESFDEAEYDDCLECIGCCGY